jgi:hypothetical protein
MTEAIGTDTQGAALVDRRKNRRLLEEIGTDEKLYKRNPNRLSNVRWKLGEEPYADAVGTSKDDPWINIELEVVENPEKIDQRDLLSGGPEIKMNCATCMDKGNREPLHIAGSMSAKEILERAGFTFKADFVFPEIGVCACVCRHGHVTQLREDLARRLLV